MRAAVLPAVLLAAVTGCDLGLGSDPLDHLPADTCAPGHAPTADGCLLGRAGVRASSAAAAWAGVDAVTVAARCTDAPCDGLLVEHVQLARSPAPDETLLVVRATLAGGAAPAPSDPDHRLVLELAPPPGSADRVVDRIEAGAGAVDYRRSGSQLTPVSGGIQFFALTWTDDGYAVEIAESLLPGPAAVALRPLAQRRDGAAWVDIADADPLPVCFAVGATDDPCRGTP